MDLQESLKMATRTLIAHRLRSALTMLGIVIGNASVIAMVGIGEGAQRFVNEQLQTLGPNVLFIVPGNRETRELGGLDVPRTLVVADATAIDNQVPTVAGVAPEFNTRELITYRNRSANASVVGSNEQFLQVRGFDMAQGRFISDLDLQRRSQVLVMGADLADRLFDQQSPIGQSIRVKGVSFEVIGVMAQKGSNLGLNYDDAVLMPITTQASRIVGRRSPYGIEVSFIAVSAKNRDSMDTAEFQITNLLRLRHNIRGDDDFFINSQNTLLNIAGTITGALTIMLAAIAGISLLVGGIGIMNIMLVSVQERTQEIGLRKAIGASQQDILVQFLIEAMILSVAGGVIGTGLGVGGIVVISALTPFQAGISVVAITVAVSVSGGIGLFFGVVPARQAAKLDPIVALRSA
ncbi:Macrolide export ATP-binding/permease protein MacB [Halomicronema hongdechloris C2206]|uniref:Macrolide export ATP-binding/permease protein MacB n=1 Tax=Halomicronema hongdechloris C2206 TaxID=1641165 RepID=A0A1Z3HP02_9CYAN|nr:ABC transporter permease [Halomicronema hongdechloris]ASC72033.1 Macrolide export ATP-binding/permease protein MacB [Halomicronema hongdechloris C2206]